MYDKLPLLITAIALLAVATAAADPLDPGFVGESMSTGMDLGLVQQAKDAGIIGDSNPLQKEAGGPVSIQLGTPTFGQEAKDPRTTVGESAQGNDLQAENINVTGTWSFDLLGGITRHIDLSMIQNRDAVMGNGAMTGDNGTKRVTASGMLTSNRLSLTVMPINSLDLYKLDLSLDPKTSGTYTFYPASGATRSGDVSGTAPIDTSVPIHQAAGVGESARAVTDNRDSNTSASGFSESQYAGAGPAPVMLGQGSSDAGGISSSSSLSMVFGGSESMQSMSSMSGSM
jgi:hypothetical protein